MTEDWIDANLSGHAVIDGSNDGLPDARIKLRAKFKKDKELRRGIR